MSAPTKDVPAPAATTRPLHVLVVDDDRSLRDGCASMLKAEGCIVAAEGRGDDARELVTRRRFDVVLLDLFMTPVSGMQILQTIRETSPDTIVVIMTGEPSVDTNLQALEAGAWEYIPKPFSATQLHILIGRAARLVESRRQQSAVSATSARTSGSTDTTPTTGGRGVILGASPAFHRALTLARRVAATDASVVLIGESGTGKEMIARFIHAHSRRARKTLMPINCAALPEALLESEMFGHRRGAFTGADRDKPGLLETTHEGTLFLDELTEMSQSIQAKLLRVLQDGRLRRVGSEEEDRAVDVRIISASNRDPQQAVRDGILRQDLFFRLWVFPIHLPPLRERLDDIEHLARHFVAHYWMKHRGPSVPPPVLGRDALEELRRRPWLGNVRELQNCMERLTVNAEAGATIEPQDLPVSGEPVQAAEASPAIGTTRLMTSAYHVAKEELIAGFERSYLEHLVQRADHNLSRAARLASIDRTTLYRLLEKHGLQRSDFIDTHA
jgi:DNA-binding NtrC family response regulator